MKKCAELTYTEQPNNNKTINLKKSTSAPWLPSLSGGDHPMKRHRRITALYTNAILRVQQLQLTLCGYNRGTVDLLEVSVIDQRHLRGFGRCAYAVTESPERSRARVVGYRGLKCAVVTEIVVSVARSGAVVALDLRTVIVHGHRSACLQGRRDVTVEVTVAYAEGRAYSRM